MACSKLRHLKRSRTSLLPLRSASKEEAEEVGCGAGSTQGGLRAGTAARQCLGAPHGSGGVCVQNQDQGTTFNLSSAFMFFRAADHAVQAASPPSRSPRRRPPRPDSRSRHDFQHSSAVLFFKAIAARLALPTVVPESRSCWLCVMLSRASACMCALCVSRNASLPGVDCILNYVPQRKPGQPKAFAPKSNVRKNKGRKR